MPLTSPSFPNGIADCRPEPEVRRARLRATLEKNRAQGRAEGLSDEIITQSNNDIVRAFDTTEAFADLFRALRP